MVYFWLRALEKAYYCKLTVEGVVDSNMCLSIRGSVIYVCVNIPDVIGSDKICVISRRQDAGVPPELQQQLRCKYNKVQRG